VAAKELIPLREVKKNESISIILLKVRNGIETGFFGIGVVFALSGRPLSDFK
jgi:hypothetical protein